MQKAKFFSAQFWTDLCFSLFLLTFTFPLRKAIYQAESFQTGLFSEYLTVFLEFNEIFLALTFVFFAFICSQSKVQSNFKWLILLFLLSLELPIFFAKSTHLAYFGFLKLIEVFALAYFVFRSKYSLERIAGIFLIVALVQGLLAVFQFLYGQNLGLWFLGEQPASIHSVGSPKIIIDGAAYLRAEGTFLHPNILACFLLFSFFMAEHLKAPYRILRWLLLVPLLFTFSRAGLIAFVLATLINRRNLLVKSVLIITLALVVFWIPEIREILTARLQIDNSFRERWDLLVISKDMLIAQPWGVGAKNFVLNMPALNTWLYQPVHNIFLLTANENGVFNALLLVLIFILAIIKNTQLRPVLIVLLVFACFDHFLLTIHAGAVLLAIGLGLAFRQQGFIERAKVIFKKVFT